MAYTYRTFGFLLLSLFACLPLCGQPLQYEELVIDSVDFMILGPHGKKISAPDLCSHIKTREGDFFSQNVFDNDLKVLSQEFAQVTPRLKVHGNSVSVRIEVSLRPTICKIIFNGNHCYQPHQLMGELDIQPGTVFDRLSFNRAVRKLKAFYVSKGYFEVEVDYTIESNPACDEVDIFITVCEGRCGKIKRIIFHNFEKCEKEVLLERMVTKEWSFFKSWFNDDGIYNSDAIEHDRYQILDYIQNRGYADAQIDIDICESRSSNRIDVHITANKGAFYTFGPLSFEGNTLFSYEEINRLFTIREGFAYSPEDIRNTVTNILNLYGRHGYIDAIVDYEPKPEGNNPVYSVHFTIEEGEQFRVGLIKVFGNTCTKTDIILHETLLIPGEIFDIERLRATELKLLNVGYFCSVNVYAVRSGDHCSLGGSYRDVHIEVEEQSTGNFSAFGGFSNVENAFVGIQITEKNFNWRGISNFWNRGFGALRGGGEYAYIKTTVGAKSRNYALSWTKPYFNDTPWIVGFDIEHSNVRYVSSQYESNAYSLVVHGKYPINAYLRCGTYYRIRNSHIKINNKTMSQQLKKEGDNNGFVSAIGVNIAYDSTDRIQKPSCGFRSRLEMEYAGIASPNIFFGIGYLNSYYVPMTCDDIIKVRWDARFIQPFGGTSYSTMPIDERLFLGGDTGVRGYRPYALGPKFKGTQDPRGGLSMTVFSGEVVHRFSDSYEAFAFFDTGNLSGNTWDFDMRHLRSSVGIGVRMCVIPGGPPVTLGYGWPIKEKNQSNIKKFFFSLGGSF